MRSQPSGGGPNNDLEGGANASLLSSSPSHKEPMRSEVLRISAVIGFYFIVSLSMVFLNKLVLDQLEFPYALFLTWFQLLIQLVCVVACGWLGKRISMLAIFPPFEFDWGIARQVMPLTIIYLCMIVFNNLCLQFVQVSFYQVARSLTVLWTALFTRLVLGKSVSILRMTAVCVVFAGFVVGSKGEKLFDWLGLISGVVASVFVALYGIYVKRVLPAVNNSEWRLLIYNTVLALFLLFPVVVLKGELAVIIPTDPAFTSDPRTWIVLAISGLMGFIINIAIFMQIKNTSPLTNAISGTVKAAVQTLLGVVLFGNIISGLNFIGIVMVIAGSFWYGQVTFRENQAERERESGKV